MNILNKPLSELTKSLLLRQRVIQKVNFIDTFKLNDTVKLD